jgi:hypothetical protein
LLDTFARLIAVALKAGDTAIVVATDSHRETLALRLTTKGLDVDAVTQQGTYISLDAADTVSTLMVKDMPDPARVFEVVGGILAAAAKAAKRKNCRVVASGECSPLLWAQGKPDAAIRLEQLWGEVCRIFDVDILCGYALSSFHGEEDEHVFQRVCAEHSAVYSR